MLCSHIRIAVLVSIYFCAARLQADEPPQVVQLHTVGRPCQEHELSDRTKKLIEALEGKRSWPPKALEEIATTKVAGELAKPVLELFATHADRGLVSLRHIDALSNIPETWDEIIRALETRSPVWSNGYSDYLYCAARQGRGAEAKIEAIRRQWKRVPTTAARGVEPFVRMANSNFRIVVASMGDRSPDLRKDILRDLEDDVRSFTGAVLKLRETDWVSDKMIKRLVTSLNESNYRFDCTAQIAMTLGIIGKRAEKATPRIDTLRKQSLAALDTLVIDYSLAQMRLEAAPKGEIVRDLLAVLPTIVGRRFSLSFGAMLDGDCYALIDSRMCKQLARELGNSDSKVFHGATLLLFSAGPECSDTVSDVFETYSKTKDETRRKVLYALVKKMANTRHMGLFTRALESSKTRNDRQAIQGLIDAVVNLQITSDDVMDVFGPVLMGQFD